MRNKNKNRIFRFNRRIRGQTDYQLRLRMLKSGLTRAVIRKSNNNMTVQFVDFDQAGDKIITSAKSNDLKRSFGFTLHTGNLPAAYLTGYLAGKRLLKSGHKSEVIVDLGMQRSIYGNRLYAAVKGILDAGVNIKTSDVVFPDESRINGEHLSVKDAGKVIEKTKKAIEGMK